MSDIPLWSIVLLGIVWITALVLWPERKKYDKSAKSSSAVIELNECDDVSLERNEFVGERGTWVVAHRIKSLFMKASRFLIAKRSSRK